MTTEVIILAQGTQKRMGPGACYKQLLPLPACNGVPILVRTLIQLGVRRLSVTIVTWSPIMRAMDVPYAEIEPWRAILRARPLPNVHHVELETPGNSSLKGISRYLELRGTEHRFNTIVLLGDVVYSWKCLDALFALSATSGFVGSRDVSESTGELWGLAWAHNQEPRMLDDLRDAVLRHPPFEDEYQPGQLRRWITGMRRGELALHVASLTHKGRYIAIDDYTMDVDVPSHIPKLGPASVAAAADDALHDLTWETP